MPKRIKTIAAMASATASMLTHWREAATLILVSPCATRNRPKLSFVLNSSDHIDRTSGFKEKSQDYEVLMLKRSSKSKFMPNLYVYPGGVAVDNDFSSDWISIFGKIGINFQQSLFNKLTQGSADAAPMFQRLRSSEHCQIPPEIAFRISAIRETFEESGVLIASPVGQVEEISQSLSKSWTFSPTVGLSDAKIMEKWREIVNKNPNEFLRMCHELDVVPAVWTLYEWSNWLTPVSAIEKGRRFDTIFYICCLDHKPDAYEDAAETVHSMWKEPSSFLSLNYKNELVLAPPQIYETSRLLHFKSHINLMNFSAQREQQRVKRFLPILVVCKDFFLAVLPGDDLYPENPDDTPFIYSDKTFEELCEEHSHWHRTCHAKDHDTGKRKRPTIVQCNMDIGRGHVGPLMGFERQFDGKGNL